MTEFPFGFGPPNPDDSGKKEPSDGENPQEAFNQLGQMLSQLGQMLSQAGTSAGPVNYDLAKQIAMQRLTSGDVGFTTSTEYEKAVTDAMHLAEMWLDPVTILPAGATSVKSWTPRDWVENTLATWQRLCDPVARRVSGAWVDALPAEAKQAAGPLLSMVGQMGGMAFGSQLGNALAQLASEVLTSTDIGLPLGPPATAALLGANIEEFTKGLERPNSEVMVFLAAREAAHQRLFAHVPWLRQRLLATVEEFASGIRVDTAALEQLATQIDPANPQSIEEAMQSGMLEPQTTPEQKVALTRLETLLALVEGWVDVVVGDAVRVADHHVHPALYQGQERLQPGQGHLLLRGGLGLQHARLHRLLDRLRVRRVDLRGELFERRGVHADAARELLHRREQALPQPRHVREQTLVRGLAGGEEHHHLAVRALQPLRELLDVRSQQSGRRRRAQGETDVGRGQDLR